MSRAVYIQRKTGCVTFYDGKEGSGKGWRVDPATVAFYEKETVNNLCKLGFIVPKDLELVEVSDD